MSKYFLHLIYQGVLYLPLQEITKDPWVFFLLGCLLSNNFDVNVSIIGAFIGDDLWFSNYPSNPLYQKNVNLLLFKREDEFTYNVLCPCSIVYKFMCLFIYKYCLADDFILYTNYYYAYYAFSRKVCLLVGWWFHYSHIDDYYA